MKHLLLPVITIIYFGLTNCKANNNLGIENTGVGFFNKANPIEKFWTWFKANEKRLRRFEENPDKYLTEVLTQAKKIQPGLAIELEPPQNGIINMTVSADGDKNLFNVVKNIIAKAPRVVGWKFIAFRQRMDTATIKRMKLGAGDYELNPAQMKFFPVIEGDTLSLIIFAKGVTEENYISIAYRGLILLDSILGEYDCVTKVKSYDFHNMPTTNEELEGLLPLLDLAAYVDKFHSSKKH